MKNRRRALIPVFVSVYALSTIIGAVMAASDETFRFGEWLFSGSLYPWFVLFYHVLMIVGCILMLKKNNAKASKHALMATAVLLAVARLIDSVKSLIPLINMFGLRSPEVNKVFAEALVRPGGAAAEVLLIIIIFLLFYKDAASAQDAP